MSLCRKRKLELLTAYAYRLHSSPRPGLKPAGGRCGYNGGVHVGANRVFARHLREAGLVRDGPSAIMRTAYASYLLILAGVMLHSSAPPNEPPSKGEGTLCIPAAAIYPESANVYVGSVHNAGEYLTESYAGVRTSYYSNLAAFLDPAIMPDLYTEDICIGEGLYYYYLDRIFAIPVLGAPSYVQAERIMGDDLLAASFSESCFLTIWRNDTRYFYRLYYDDEIIEAEVDWFKIIPERTYNDILIFHPSMELNERLGYDAEMTDGCSLYSIGEKFYGYNYLLDILFEITDSGMRYKELIPALHVPNNKDRRITEVINTLVTVNGPYIYFGSPGDREDNVYIFRFIPDFEKRQFFPEFVAEVEGIETKGLIASLAVFEDTVIVGSWVDIYLVSICE